MKILYIANIRLPTEKAHGVQIMKMCEAFAELGHDVTLVVPWRTNSIKQDPFEYYNVNPLFKVRRVFSIDLIKFGKYGFLIQYFSFTVAAALVARMSGTTLIYTRDPSLVYACGVLGKRAVWEMHVAMWSRIQKKAAAHAKKIVVISKGLADFYTGNGVDAQKIYIARDAADMRDFALGESKNALRTTLELPQDKKILSYVGKFKTIGQSKGVEEIIYAAGKLVQKDPTYFFLLVGLNEHEFPEAKAAVVDAGLPEGNYMLVGHVPRSLVPAYLQASDVLVMSYPNTEHYAKMMSPLKLFEYMASGTPIVTSDLPTIREVLSEESAVLVVPDSIEALQAGIERLINDPSLGARLAAAALHDIKKYTWQNRAKEILSTVAKSA